MYSKRPQATKLRHFVLFLETVLFSPSLCIYHLIQPCLLPHLSVSFLLCGSGVLVWILPEEEVIKSWAQHWRAVCLSSVETIFKFKHCFSHYVPHAISCTRLCFLLHPHDHPVSQGLARVKQLKACSPGLLAEPPQSPPFFFPVTDFHALNCQLIILSLNGAFLCLISFFFPKNKLPVTWNTVLL